MFETKIIFRLGRLSAEHLDDFKEIRYVYRLIKCKK